MGLNFFIEFIPPFNILSSCPSTSIFKKSILLILYSLTNKSYSGLNRSKKILENLKEIEIIDFNHTDVVRHPLVSKIVKAYSENND